MREGGYMSSLTIPPHAQREMLNEVKQRMARLHGELDVLNEFLQYPHIPIQDARALPPALGANGRVDWYRTGVYGGLAFLHCLANLACLRKPTEPIERVAA